MKTIEDYRVVERVSGFVIQKRFITEYKNGFLFWSKWKQTIKWRDVDSEGNVLVHYLGGTITESKVYASLEEAKVAIEKFLKYPIYHYFTKDDEIDLPTFPKDIATQ